MAKALKPAKGSNPAKALKMTKASNPAEVGKSSDKATANFAKGLQMVASHPLFLPLYRRATTCRARKDNLCPADGWAVVESSGHIHVHPRRLAKPEEWAYVIAHCLLHLAFDHIKTVARPIEWGTACDLQVTNFLDSLKFGTPPANFNRNLECNVRNEITLFEQLCSDGIPPEYKHQGTAGAHMGDMVVKTRPTWSSRPIDWQKKFAEGLSDAVTRAVDIAGGAESTLCAKNSPQTTAAQKARRWMISSYPLLGALAASFKLIEDAEICRRMQIPIAAVNAELAEIYINPPAAKDEDECRFILAHEFMHVGLRHHARRQGRDPYLWNVACDYVINCWLVEMRLGSVPPLGGLYDPELKGLSAESVYDRIVTDLRKFRKLATLRGNCGMGDMIDGEHGEWWDAATGTSLDDFYRRALTQGLTFHECSGRGTLPAGLIEEIRALNQPAIPWDVKLAQWFDRYFPPVDKVRTYAQQSRRQASTPDIPRPRYAPGVPLEARTFAVLLDTSGSMSRSTLGKALGSIASYSISRDVPFARVVFCDALPYDQGYLAPDAIADTVKIKGRGGTVLQPGIDLLERAEDFPKTGPILIITDGGCDRLTVRREHAYLLPIGSNLPFRPTGEVFQID